MTRPVSLHADAVAELEAAALWYEGQRAGLGLQLLAAVDRAIERVRDWPHAGSAVSDLPNGLTVRRQPVDRFPYHVLYLLDQHSVYLLAVAHDHRRPGYWKHRRPNDAG